MLQKHSSSNGVVFYFSPLLRAIGVRHAFSTRIGGISEAPFDSLNLGNPMGCEIQDDYERIWQNYSLLHKAADCATGKPCRVHQVHGAGVARVLINEDFDTSTKADALITDDPTRVLSVRVADCVPVLIADEKGASVAAIHAGWRGVIAGVVPAALRELAAGKNASRCVAAIGPCIGYDAFEVGSEVLDEFVRVFGPQAPCRDVGGGKGRVDLREAIRRQLISAGIPDEQIDVSEHCTWSDREQFYSHRRDRGITGRMAAIIQAA